jgi:hypothetical protein
MIIIQVLVTPIIFMEIVKERVETAIFPFIITVKGLYVAYDELTFDIAVYCSTPYDVVRFLRCSQLRSNCEHLKIRAKFQLA